MGLHNRRPDPIQQLGAVSIAQRRILRKTRRKSVLARHELVDERIADLSAPRPLLVRPLRGALKFNDQLLVAGKGGDGAECVGVVDASSVPRPVDEIHRIAGLHVVVCPARSSVTVAHVVQHLGTAAVHKHHGRLVTLLGRNQVLHERRGLGDLAVRHVQIGRAHV